MSEHSNRKKLLQESLLLTRKDWLELALALYAQRASAQGYSRTFELGDWNQLTCHAYVSAAAQAQLAGRGLSPPTPSSAPSTRAGTSERRSGTAS